MIIPACEPIKSNGTTIGALVIEFDGEYFADNTVKSKKYYIIVSCCVATIVGFVTIVMLRSLSIPRYKWLAYTDLLTGTKNRNAFELATYKLRGTDQQKDIIVLRCDLNKLKTINDLFGHAEGDEKIRELAQLIINNFSSMGDTYRIGGDEFITLIRNTSVERVEQIVAEMRLDPKKTTEGMCPLSFSYGIARFDQSQDNTIDDTIYRADITMYQNKHAGRKNGSNKT